MPCLSKSFFKSPPSGSPGLFGFLCFLLLLLFLVSILVWSSWPAMFSPAFSDDSISLKEATSDTWASSLSRKDYFGYFRPLKTLFFYLWVNFYSSAVAFSPDSSWKFHMYGSGFYYLSVFSLGVFLWFFLPRMDGKWRSSRLLPAFCLLACFFWGFSASNMLTAHWVSASNIPLCGVALMAVCLFQLLDLGLGKKFLLLFFSGLLGLFLYDTAIAAVPLLLGLNWIRGCSWKEGSFLSGFAGLCLAVLVFLVLRSFVGASVMPAVPDFYDAGMVRLEVFLCAPWFVLTHLRMWFFPWGSLQVYSSFHLGETVTWQGVLVSWFLLAGLLFLLFRYGRRRPVAGFGLVWFLAVMSPCSNFIPIYTTHNDYYAVLPGVGLSFAVADLVFCAFRKFPSIRFWWVCPLRVPFFAGLALVFLFMRLLVAFEYADLCRRFWDPTDYLVYIHGNYGRNDRLAGILAHRYIWAGSLGYSLYFADLIGPDGRNPSIYSECRARVLLRSGKVQDLDRAVDLIEDSRRKVCGSLNDKMKLFQYGVLMQAYSLPVSRHYSLKKADIIGALVPRLPESPERSRLLAKWASVRKRMGLPVWGSP